MRYAHITGWGVAIPEKVLTNDDIAEIVDTNDEWITTRTGIRERRIAGPGEETSAMAAAAAEQALAMAEKVMKLVKEGRVVCKDESEIELKADTICVHGDNPSALSLVQKIRETLQASGIEIAPPETFL